MTPRPSPWQTLAVCVLAVFLASLDGTVLYVAFDDIRRTFPDVPPSGTSWILTAYTIAFGALLVPAGRLADRYGRKRAFLGGVALFTAGSLGCGLAPSVAWLVTARVLQAAGAAALLPSSLAIVLDAFPPERRGTAVGVWGAVGGLAAALGPALGAFVVERFGWPWVFFLNGPVGAFALVQGARVLRESASDGVRGIPDPLGIALVVAASATGAWAVVAAPERGWGNVEIGVAAWAGVLGAVAFVARCRRVPDPAMDLSLFGERAFSIANAAGFCFSVVFSTMFLGNVFFLTHHWGYGLREAGLAISPGPLTVIPVAVLSGRLADRFGYRVLIVGGALLFALGGAWLWLTVDQARDFLRLWLPASLLTGAACGLLFPSLAGAAVSSLPRARLALGSAVNQALRQLGSVFGVALVVALTGRGGAAATGTQFHALYGVLVAGGLVVAAIGAALPAGRGKAATAAPAAA